LTLARIELAASDDRQQINRGAERFRRLAENGNVEAQIALGLMFTFGQGVEQDYEEGRFWLKLASNQGSGAAQLNLGNIYAEGIGVERDNVTAYAWYAISASHGEEVAAGLRDTLAQELDEASLARGRELAGKLGSAMPLRGTGITHEREHPG